MKRLWWAALLLAAPLFAQDEDAYRKALERNPRNIEVYLAYLKALSNPQQITDVGNEALAAVGERFDIYTAVGDSLFAARDYRRAVNAYRRAQALNPRSATGYNRLGIALLRTGNYRQAEVSFKAAASYTGSINARSSYLANLGLALESSQENDKALEAFSEALKVNPNNVAAKEGKARLAPTNG